MATGCSYLLICMLMVHNNYTRVLNRVASVYKTQTNLPGGFIRLCTSICARLSGLWYTCACSNLTVQSAVECEMSSDLTPIAYKT